MTETTDTQVPTLHIDSPDLEIVGLNAANNNRSCSQHETCGEHVIPGDVLRLVRCVVTIKGETEEAIKLVKIADGTATCTVAFVPRVFAKEQKVLRNINKFVQVLELYSDSDNSHKRRMSYQNLGMASVAFLDDIPVNE